MVVSAVVLTKNEEKNIQRCLDSLKWCDEIIVLDDNSTDKTSEITKRYNVKFFTRSLDSDFSSQRNFGLEHSSGDWVFFVDADEEVSLSLQNEILALLHDQFTFVNGCLVKRIDHIFGTELRHGEQGSIRLLRLAKKDSGLWKGKVHEQWSIKGKKTILQNPLHHYPHASIGEFLREINYYTTLRAKELYEMRKTTNLFQILLFPFGKLVANYAVKHGFLDRTAGIVVALLMSLHSFLTRAKLWVLWNKKI